jgi:Flp pilus assembly protein TadD
MGSLFGLKIVALGVLILFQEGGATERFNRAVALQQRGEMAAAVDEYREAIRMRPDYVEAHANLAVALVRLGRSDEAVLAYEAALRLAPGLTPVRLNLGILHYRTGRFEAAIEVFERILREQPRSIQASQLCGLALSALGRDEEAIARLAPTIDAAPPDPAVLYSLGLGYLRLGRAGFRAILERLAALPAGRPVLHLLQGQAFLRDQNYETALEELRSAARLSADLPRLHFSLGVAHSLLGQNKEAIAAAKDGNFGQARRRVEESLRLDPKSPEATGLLGKILLREGKAAEAVKLLESAVRAPGKTSTDHDLHYNLARAYQQLGRREDATRQFAEVQRLKAAQLRKDRANLPGQ